MIPARTLALSALAAALAGCGSTPGPIESTLGSADSLTDVDTKNGFRVDASLTRKLDGSCDDGSSVIGNANPSRCDREKLAFKVTITCVGVPCRFAVEPAAVGDAQTTPFEANSAAGTVGPTIRVVPQSVGSFSVHATLESADGQTKKDVDLPITVHAG